MSKERLLQPGDKVAEVWEVINLCGQGTFSEVYTVSHGPTGVKAALKLDKSDTSSLQQECRVLLGLQKYPFFCRLHGFHATPMGKPVQVMQLLGNNVSQVRFKSGDRSVETVTVKGALLLGLQAMHREGFLHRDIKPSNFVFSLDTSTPWHLYLVDFGLSKKYCSSAGDHIIARDTAEFRGTSLYASLNSHKGMDFGRRDDLWCIFHAVLDMALRGVPWRKFKSDRNKCMELKAHYYNRLDELVNPLPEPARIGLLAFANHLKGLKFEDKPNYGMLASVLSRAADKLKYAESPVDNSAFDVRALPLACDGLLESRGGMWEASDAEVLAALPAPLRDNTRGPTTAAEVETVIMESVAVCERLDSELAALDESDLKRLAKLQEASKLAGAGASSGPSAALPPELVSVSTTLAELRASSETLERATTTFFDSSKEKGRSTAGGVCGRVPPEAVAAWQPVAKRALGLLKTALRLGFGGHAQVLDLASQTSASLGMYSRRQGLFFTEYPASDGEGFDTERLLQLQLFVEAVNRVCSSVLNSYDRSTEFKSMSVRARETEVARSEATRKVLSVDSEERLALLRQLAEASHRRPPVTLPAVGSKRSKANKTAPPAKKQRAGAAPE